MKKEARFVVLIAGSEKKVSSLTKAWNAIGDGYSDVEIDVLIPWKITELSTGRYCNENMSAMMFEALAESPAVFGQWLDIFGWK